jgi:hypothetical protein
MRFENFAFCGRARRENPRKTSLRYFVELVNRRTSLHVFPVPPPARKSPGSRTRRYPLAQKLRKPVGVMASNDDRAQVLDFVVAWA